MYTTNLGASISYIGVNHKDIDLFENQYIVPNGVSYNSYLIQDEKIALMDTVDARCSKEWLLNLENALNGRALDYIVVLHMEPDHSGSLKDVLQKYPQAKVVGNVKTFQMIARYFDLNIEDRKVLVKENESLPLGESQLTFYMAPMVHWPEVMVAYEKKSKTLFSADAFGKFGTLDTQEDWDCEARRYYFNIVGKYGVQVQNLLKKVCPLDIQCICPLHGPILSDNLAHYVEKYNIWSSYTPENQGVTIACASIHGNTMQGAKLLQEKLQNQGIKVSLFDLARDDMAEAIEDAFRYDKLVLACATYNNELFPPMESFLHHLKSKNYQNRTVGLMENGSWAPVAAKQMKDVLSTLKNITLCETIVTIPSAVNQTALEQMDSLVKELAE